MCVCVCVLAYLAVPHAKIIFNNVWESIDMKCTCDLRQGGPDLIRLRFAHGTVRAVLVFGSDGSSLEKFFSVRLLF